VQDDRFAVLRILFVAFASSPFAFRFSSSATTMMQNKAAPHKQLHSKSRRAAEEGVLI
jgi:hypothetical protein